MSGAAAGGPPPAVQARIWAFTAAQGRVDARDWPEVFDIACFLSGFVFCLVAALYEREKGLSPEQAQAAAAEFLAAQAALYASLAALDAPSRTATAAGPAEGAGGGKEST